MGSIANGLAAYGGIIPFTATFLVFSDYMRPPIRLAALMKQHVIFVFTHDAWAEAPILHKYLAGEELSYDEISEVLKTSVGGLKANYFHALRKVQEFMRHEISAGKGASA